MPTIDELNKRIHRKDLVLKVTGHPNKNHYDFIPNNLVSVSHLGGYRQATLVNYFSVFVYLLKRLKRGLLRINFTKDFNWQNLHYHLDLRYKKPLAGFEITTIDKMINCYPVKKPGRILRGNGCYFYRGSSHFSIDDGITWASDIVKNINPLRELLHPYLSHFFTEKVKNFDSMRILNINNYPDLKTVFSKNQIHGDTDLNILAIGAVLLVMFYANKDGDLWTL